MDSNETGKVSVMTEVGMAEDLPNSADDSAFHESQHDAHGPDGDHQMSHEHPDTVTIATGQPGINADHVFVATSQGLLTAEQLQEVGIKTTHIVIHDQTLEELNACKTPTTPIPPPTPATPKAREHGFKYQWDDAVHLEILPVRCKNSNGELHKAKFGSGGRGRCIKMDDNWYTPSEFEAMCGRASSKDWKRSIRYGGRPLQCLIEDNILHPHATSCTCAACCDDEAVTGPVRLFIPYKRRKRDSVSGMPAAKKRSPSVASLVSASAVSPPAVVSASQTGSQQQALVGHSPQKEAVVVSLAASNGHGIGQPIQVGRTETGETIHILGADASGNLVAEFASDQGVTLEAITKAEPTVVMTQVPQTPKVIQNNQTIQSIQPIQAVQNSQNLAQQLSQSMQQVHSIVPVDGSDNKQWQQLEELANNLLQQAQQLKNMIEVAKQQSISTRETQLLQLKNQMEKEKQEAMNAVRIEAQMNLSRVVMDERAQKDIAVQQALTQARAEMQEKMDSVTVVENTDKVTYNVTWTANPMIDGEGEESDKEKD